jgi:hypothetical protein
LAVRHSEYERMPDDCYVTPAWVWQLLFKAEPWAVMSADPAPVNRSDEYDFLGDWDIEYDIATNPPFKHAEKFVRHALYLPTKVNCAFLLPHAWDTAKGRVDLFRDRRFKAKYVITQRIRWANIVQKKAGPSSNHAWFVWRSEPRGFVKPVMGWL